MKVRANPTGPTLGTSSVPNLRDVGGQPTRDGRSVRTGLLYRSGSLQHDSTAPTMEAFGLELARIRRVL